MNYTKDYKEVTLSIGMVKFLNKLIKYHTNILKQVYDITKEDYCINQIEICEILLLKLFLYTLNHKKEISLTLNVKEAKLLNDICFNYFEINYTIVKTDEVMLKELRKFYKVIIN
ncbi:hypothetical protein [Paramaledivibacter caminithermalis]|jgi:hypothetical protein|uniref:Uncharacterized protein n=1 Tax=Paramaledivibacter caminithermalis (strain DSM 15212 / CIP 107654 / DViRD3) TaxID=1121301 RepID=A0A1M6M8S7_PARC5|nr:hypothetical protein [Paramaledivibacter caminithermalis]SHJ79875.1 hypothetical protein SAMN02745912_01136 [Paramaledivibacter caminithermalis DSM 15212]